MIHNLEGRRTFSTPRIIGGVGWQHTNTPSQKCLKIYKKKGGGYFYPTPNSLNNSKHL